MSRAEDEWANGFVEWAISNHELRMQLIRATGRQPTGLDFLQSIYSVKLDDYPTPMPKRGIWARLRRLFS